jgi:PAS domain-containing protein
MMGFTAHALSGGETHQEDHVLTSSEERVRAVSRDDQPLVFFTSDAIGLVSAWSLGAEALLGWTADEMVGMPAQLLLASGSGTPHGIAPDLPRGASEQRLLHRSGGQISAVVDTYPMTGSENRLHVVRPQLPLDMA